MDPTACTETQCLYKGALYLYFTYVFMFTEVFVIFVHISFT